MNRFAVYREKNREKCVTATMRWRKNNQDWVKAYNKQYVLRKYNLTVEEYNKILERQNKVCAICKKENTNGSRLAVDHDHVTGKVRGLLCVSCNNGLGRFKDNINFLENAINYLKETQY